MSNRSSQPVDFNIYLITDQEQTAGRGLLSTVEQALAGGVRGVQLREKARSAREYYEIALALRDLTNRFGARLLINDRIDIALAVGADGVHLPESGMPVAATRSLFGRDRFIGVSCHSLAAACDAERYGADFITFGPVFHTPSKMPYGEPLGVEALAEVNLTLSIPVFALGGVSRQRAPQLLDSGIHRIACISALLAAADPCAEAQFLSGLVGPTT